MPQDNRTSSEIGNNVDKLRRDLKIMIRDLGEIEHEVAVLKRERLGMTCKIKDKEMILDKAKRMKQELDAEIKIEESSFWNAKHAGL